MQDKNNNMGPLYKGQGLSGASLQGTRPHAVEGTRPYAVGPYAVEPLCRGQGLGLMQWSPSAGDTVGPLCKGQGLMQWKGQGPMQWGLMG